MALTDKTALAYRLGRALTTEEDTRADSVIADASDVIETYCRASLTETASVTEILPVHEGKVLLPRTPVVEVSTVELPTTTSPVSYESAGWTTIPTAFDGLRTVGIDCWEDVLVNAPEWWWSSPVRSARITWTHGYGTIPTTASTVAVTVAVRALIGSSADKIGVRSEQAGPFMRTFSAATGHGGAYLTREEKRRLRDAGLVTQRRTTLPTRHRQ